MGSEGSASPPTSPASPSVLESPLDANRIQVLSLTMSYAPRAKKRNRNTASFMRHVGQVRRASASDAGSPPRSPQPSTPHTV
jgi:hypothetical protein